MKTVVLVLEDERPLLEAIKAKLEMAGFEVLLARSVKQGLDYLDSVKNIDVVWLDHYLAGEGSGLDFMENIKSRGGKFKDIPIFLVSNTASPDKVEAYKKLGINKYYLKAANRIAEIVQDIETELRLK